MVADALGDPLSVAADHEASSRGAALIALQSIGAIADAAAVPPPATSMLAPVPERTDIYRRALARQIALGKAVTAWEESIVREPEPR
jgi:gluconokinase